MGKNTNIESSPKTIEYSPNRSSVLARLVLPLLAGISFMALYAILSLIAVSTFVSKDADLDIAGSIPEMAVTMTAVSVVTLALVFKYSKLVGGRASIGLTWPKDIGFLVRLPIVFVAYFALSLTAMILTGSLAPDVDLDTPQNIGFDAVNGPAQAIGAYVLLAILPPLVEEFIFRGIIFKGMYRGLGFWVAAVISSLLFGLAHGQVNLFIDTFFLGMAASWLTWRYDSILPAILLHGAKNSLAYLAIFVF